MVSYQGIDWECVGRGSEEVMIDALFIPYQMGQTRYYEELLAKTEADLAQDACGDDQLTIEEQHEANQVSAFYLQ